MAKIKNFVLPQELNEVLVGELEKVTKEDLVKLSKCLPGGFKTPAAIRDQLARLIRSNGPLHSELVRMYEVNFLGRATVRALSEAALQTLFESLSTILGREQVIIALLLDGRSWVHEFGIKQANQLKSAPPKQDLTAARKLFMNFMEQYLYKDVGVDLVCKKDKEGQNLSIESGLRAQADKLAGMLDDHKEMIAHLKQELQQVRQDHQVKLKELAAQADQEKKDLIEQQEVLKAQVGRIQEEKETLLLHLEQVRAEINASVAKGVKEQTNALAKKWLEEPQNLEATAGVEAGRAKDLLERSELALEKQAQMDRHSGTRHELEKRLHRLNEVHSRLLSASQTALRPVPELRSVAQEVELEIEHLQKLLVGKRPLDGIAAQLLVRINASSAWDQLRDCGHLIQELADRELLSQSDRRVLYEMSHRKFSLLEEQSKPREAEEDNGWSLRGALSRNQSILILLDGYNMLFGLKDIFEGDFENNRPGAKARQKLVAMIDTLVKDKHNVKAKVCFDSPNANVVEVSQNVAVEFSGGNGQHRADELIVSRLQFSDLQSVDQKVFVVTDDWGIRRDILKTGCKFVPNDAFAVVLNDFGCLEAKQ